MSEHKLRTAIDLFY